MDEKNNNNRQLVLPLISDCEIEYKEIVKQNWKFTFSRQYLTSVNTKRVIGLIIAQMKEEGEMRDFYQVRAADIIRKTDVAKEEVYRTMRETIFELVNVAFFFEDAKNHEIIPRHLLDTTRFENPASYKNGVLTVALNPTLRDIIMQLAHYSQFELDSYMNFSSWYSMRLWELLSAFKDTGWWYSPIEEYRELMGCGIAYDNKGNQRKEKDGSVKYMKYQNNSMMIKKTTAEPIIDFVGTDLEFVVNPVYEERSGRGRPRIIGVRFDLVFHQLSAIEKIEYWSAKNEKFAKAVARLQAWGVSNENIVKYTHAIGRERVNQLLYSWQMKNTSKDPIGNKLVYCNKAFVAEGKKAIEARNKATGATK